MLKTAARETRNIGEKVIFQGVKETCYSPPLIKIRQTMGRTLSFIIMENFSLKSQSTPRVGRKDGVATSVGVTR